MLGFVKWFGAKSKKFAMGPMVLRENRRRANNFCLFRERKCAGEPVGSKRGADLSASRESVEGNAPWEQVDWAKAQATLTTCWRRLGYLPPIQVLHALSVGAVADALTRTRQAPQHDR
ncbi:MAG: hypothetical protein DRP09_14350 [Candidatus Thorarchaeota archaeon]|nr:MAG: hypothetical protein DRP09_14350 [Candidatus Thorarchaeota archaeon]